MHRVTIVLLLLVVTLTACQSREDDFREDPDIKNSDIVVTIERLEHELMSQPTEAALAQWMDEHPVIRDLMWRRDEYVNPETGEVDSAFFIESVWEVLHYPAFADTVYGQTQSEFADISDLEEQLTLAFRRLAAIDPNFTPPVVQSVISGFGRGVYVSDSLWIVSLENFIGPEAIFRPMGPNNTPLPEYLSRRYRREYIVSILLKSYAPNYVMYNDRSSNTFLDEMFTYGKLFEFTKTVLPELPDSIIVRYNTTELAGLEANAAYIWSHFLENEMLFNTNYFEYRPYIEEAPKTLEVSNNCPGRVGRYVGWQILEEYRRQNPEVSLLELMANPNSQSILEGSKYKP